LLGIAPGCGPLALICPDGFQRLFEFLLRMGIDLPKGIGRHRLLYGEHPDSARVLVCFKARGMSLLATVAIRIN